jgi:hypothetical protein
MMPKNTPMNREHGGQEADEQRVLGAHDDPGEHVPAGHRLDAERVGQADPAPRADRPAERRVDQVRVVAVRVLHQVGADERDQDEEDDEGTARHRYPVPAQPPPGDLAKRPALDGNAARDYGIWRRSARPRRRF